MRGIEPTQRLPSLASRRAPAPLSAARLGRRASAYLFVLPCIVLVIALTLFPTLYSVLISLQQWEAALPDHPFVGLANYVAVLRERALWGALQNTVVLSVACVAIELTLGFSLALILVERIPGRRIFLPLILLPIMVSPVVAAYSWKTMFYVPYGPANHILSWLLQRPITITWLQYPTTALIAIVITNVWQWTPFMFLVLLAGLAGIDRELYEAAAIDGASGWQAFWRLTVPLLLPVLLVALLFRGFDALNMFGQVFVLTQGGPGVATQTIAYHIYEKGFLQFRFGYAAAATIIWLNVVVLTVSRALGRWRF